MNQVCVGSIPGRPQEQRTLRTEATGLRRREAGLPYGRAPWGWLAQYAEGAAWPRENAPLAPHHLPAGPCHEPCAQTSERQSTASWAVHPLEDAFGGHGTLRQVEMSQSNMVDALRPHRLMRPSNLRGVMPGSQVMSPHGAKGHRCPWRGLRCSGGITGGVPCGDRELPRMVPLRHHYRFPECSLSTAMANGRPTAFNEGRGAITTKRPGCQRKQRTGVVAEESVAHAWAKLVRNRGGTTQSQQLNMSVEELAVEVLTSGAAGGGIPSPTLSSIRRRESSTL